MTGRSTEEWIGASPDAAIPPRVRLRVFEHHNGICHLSGRKIRAGGALGDFPEGRMNKTDEGAVQFAIGVKNGKVVLDFGTPVAWVGMNPQQAADLASTLVRHAREAARASGQSVTFVIG